jgi:hypothetical protein
LRPYLWHFARCRPYSMLMRPQSGHSQVTLLHDIPHSLSAMQRWHIWNAQSAHAQQKAGLSSHSVQAYPIGRERVLREVVSIMGRAVSSHSRRDHSERLLLGCGMMRAR